MKNRSLGDGRWKGSKVLEVERMPVAGKKNANFEAKVVKNDSRKK